MADKTWVELWESLDDYRQKAYIRILSLVEADEELQLSLMNNLLRLSHKDIEKLIFSLKEQIFGPKLENLSFR